MIKTLAFSYGFIATEDDLFSVSKFECSAAGSNPTVRCFINCPKEQQEHLRSEFKNSSKQIVFIGPEITGTDNHHIVFGFLNLKNLYFISSESGMIVKFGHNSIRECPYDDSQEYPVIHYINFKHNW